MNKVLIIDDDKELCALMKKCIEQEKLSAVTVYNGIEGVRLIDENKDSYSLIILDVMLPDIDGFQILQKIRDTSNIPVLMLTAKSSEEDKVFGLRLGADDYLTKPFGINELLARVNSLIRRYTTLNLYSWRLSCRRLYRFEYGNNFTGGIIIFSRWRVSSTCNAPRYFFSNIGKGICSTDWGCITLSCACRAYSVGDYGTAPTGECYGNLSLYFI